MLYERIFEMEIIEYVLLGLLLVSAVFIVVAVLMQKSSEDGLSGTIAGGSDTFYGKDKSSHSDRAIYKWTIIAAVVFMIAVLAVYVFQPDYSYAPSPDVWVTDSNYPGFGEIFD